MALRLGSPGDWLSWLPLVGHVNGSCGVDVGSSVGLGLRDDGNGGAMAEVGGVGGPVAAGEALPGNRDVGVDAQGAARIATGISVASWNSAVLRVWLGGIPRLGSAGSVVRC